MDRHEQNRQTHEPRPRPRHTHATDTLLVSTYLPPSLIVGSEASGHASRQPGRQAGGQRNKRNRHRERDDRLRGMHRRKYVSTRRARKAGRQTDMHHIAHDTHTHTHTHRRRQRSTSLLVTNRQRRATAHAQQRTKRNGERD